VSTPTKPKNENRRAIIVGSVALVILVLFVGTKVLGKSKPVAAPAASAPAPAPGSVTGLSPVTTTPLPPGTSVQNLDSAVTKDPFVALRSPTTVMPTTPAAAPTTATAGATTTSTTQPFGGTVTTTGTTSSASGGSSSSPGATATPSSGPTSTPSGSNQKVFALLSVFSQSNQVAATVAINQVEYTVQPGQVFDANYKVVDLNLQTGCGDFQFGDTPFHLCQGQQVVE
jgi:hypothetical protein